MVLKNIGVLSCGKLMGTMYAIMGLIVGGFMSLAAVVGAAAQGANAEGVAGSIVLGVGAVIILPILYGIGGFIGGLITAAIYNVVAGFVGGLEIDLQPQASQY